MSRWSPATVNLWFCVLLYLFSFFSFSEKAASALEGLSFYQDVCSGHRPDKVVHSVSGCENTWKYLIFSDFVEEMVGVLYCLFKRLEFTYSMFFFCGIMPLYHSAKTFMKRINDRSPSLLLWLEWMKSSSFQKEEILFVLNYWDTQLLLS